MGVKKNLYWNKIENLYGNDNIFRKGFKSGFLIEKQIKDERETMYSKEKLEALQRVSTIRSLTQEELAALFEQVTAQQETLEKWYGLLSLISRSGSSWSGRIREVLDEYHFGTTDAAAIEAVKTLLRKHTGKTVSEVVTLLERMDAPIKRSTR